MKRFLLILFAVVFSSNLFAPVNYLKPTYRPGKDFALLFALNEYENWEDLKYPISEVMQISEELENRFSFKPEIIKNPSRNEIFAKLEEYQNKFYADDAQLFVYFSGHGSFDERNKEGYLISSEGGNAEEDPFHNSHISHTNFRKRIENIPCNHIMVAIDACHSGTFDQSFRGGEKKFQRPGNDNTELKILYDIEERLAYNTRLFITSGGNERTPDNSEFAKAILQALRAVTVQDAFLSFRDLLSYLDSAKPKPRSGTFDGNDPGSDFLFVRKEYDSLDISDIKISSFVPPKMVMVRGGDFSLAFAPKKKLHLYDFYLSEAEISTEQFVAFLNEKGNKKDSVTTWVSITSTSSMIEEVDGKFYPKENYEHYPIAGVSWYGARAFCRWLSDKTGKNFRLPSEAEWEYTASGGATRNTTWSGTSNLDSLRSYANFAGTGQKDNFENCAPVKSLNPNSLGFYDMSGNVFEWCTDSWHEEESKLSLDGKAYEDDNSTYKVIKGGNFGNAESLAKTGYRDVRKASDRKHILGFRIARTP